MYIFLFSQDLAVRLANQLTVTHVDDASFRHIVSVLHSPSAQKEKENKNKGSFYSSLEYRRCLRLRPHRRISRMREPGPSRLRLGLSATRKRLFSCNSVDTRHPRTSHSAYPLGVMQYRRSGNIFSDAFSWRAIVGEAASRDGQFGPMHAAKQALTIRYYLLEHQMPHEQTNSFNQPMEPECQKTSAYVQVLRVQVLVEKEDRVTRSGDDAFVTYQLYSLVIIPPCTNHYALLPLRL